MDERKKRHIEWSKKQEKKPSMKRRCDEHDYTQRGIYMITMATEGRLPLFGTLKGNPLSTSGDDKPQVILSVLGERVKACWLDIPTHYPEVTVIKLCIMPDHIHGVLFVKEKMPHHLGTIINGFKAGTRKAARELGVITATMSPSKEPAPVRYIEASPQSKKPQGVLWEPGYNDRILKGADQLDRWIKYLIDNPRRLWIKRQNPSLFVQQTGVTIGAMPVTMMGNRFLLDYPEKIAVKCSQRLSKEEIEAECHRFLTMACQGVVLVSPCISPGEKEVIGRAFEAGHPIIVLIENGFAPYQKPSGRQFEACSQGRLLLVAPWPHHDEYRKITRAQCDTLNALARHISKNDFYKTT